MYIAKKAVTKNVEKALKEMTPETIIEEVKKSGLRGRGGAGFPAGMKWGFIAKPEGVPRHLVCNADESEPGTFKDRYLMEFLPHLLIEGLIISSFALGRSSGPLKFRELKEASILLNTRGLFHWK